MVDAVLIVIEDRQQPHMVDAHGLQLRQVLGILIEVLSHIEARVHGAIGMAGIHDALGDALGSGGVAQFCDDAAHQQIGVAVIFRAGSDIEAAHSDCLPRLQVHLQARVIDIMGGIPLTVGTAAVLFHLVDEEQVHMAPRQGRNGGAVDQARLDSLQFLQLRAVAMPDGGVGGEIEDHIPGHRQLRHERAGIEIKGSVGGILDRDIHLQPAALQPVAHRHIGLGEPVGHIEAIFQLPHGSGGKVEGLPGGLDGRQVPGPELQHGLILHESRDHLLIAAEVEAEAPEGQTEAIPADLQKLPLIVEAAGKMVIFKSSHTVFLPEITVGKRLLFHNMRISSCLWKVNKKLRLIYHFTGQYHLTSGVVRGKMVCVNDCTFFFRKGEI